MERGRPLGAGAVRAFRRLRSIGCMGVQSFGFYAMDWNEHEKMLDGEGLRIVDGWELEA